ncbi:MAG: hypothetical protein R3E08_02905 [Thiotrichaceae bacterium]
MNKPYSDINDMLEMLNQYLVNKIQTNGHAMIYLPFKRVLQIYVESFIGMARYLVQQKYQLGVVKSQALDELKISAQI